MDHEEPGLEAASEPQTAVHIISRKSELAILQDVASRVQKLDAESNALIQGAASLFAEDAGLPFDPRADAANFSQDEDGATVMRITYGALT